MANLCLKERFLNYISIDTESDENNDKGYPSTKGQWTLANQLVDELKELGADYVELSDKCVVYATFKATSGYELKKAVGFIAHMDTVLNGKNIKPVVIENYSGGNVVYPNGNILKVEDNPWLKDLKGRTLITSDGTTILGADDKAGVAAIMNMCQKLVNDNIPHGKVCVAFTPDEEIGCGVDNFSIEKFGADFAVTVDGGAEDAIEYENFNAASVLLMANGVNTHPGSAKGVMVNAISLLSKFHNMLPLSEVPEKTEWKEGFFHLLGMKGDVTKATSEYLIREFDRKIFEKRKQLMRDITAKINELMGGNYLNITIEDSYYNMSEIIKKNPEILECIEKSIADSGMEPKYLPIRGGTDGCRLSFEGLPCPNIGAGGYMFHSIYEHCTIEGMEKATEVMLNIISNV